MIRKANEHERRTLLGGQMGFVSVDPETDTVVGHIGYVIEPETFYVHSFLSLGETSVAAELVQRIITAARLLGYRTVQYSIEPGREKLASLFQSGKAKVIRTILEVEL